MWRKLLSVMIVLAAIAGVLLSRQALPSAGTAWAAEPKPAKKESGKVVDFIADRGYPIPVGDTTATCLVGNFAAQHNGAVILCDSAVKYDDKHIECFGNVLINKNTTYVYGDRAEYNGEINEARVYSDLVKVVDGDATLYTYEFSFNTLDNVGHYAGGGMLVNRDNQLESDRGYYYADLHEVICVERVQMRNEDYQLMSDSVVYNLETDRARFFRRTHIWSEEENTYIYADRGEYLKPRELYSLKENGYVLTDEQEMWSDSLDYYRADGHIQLYRNIQIDDTTHKVLAFGHYGEYWKEPGNALLTERPVVVSYDPSQGDTLYMRADTLWLNTLVEGQEWWNEIPADTLEEWTEVEVPQAEDPERPSEEEMTQKRAARDSMKQARAAAREADRVGLDAPNAETPLAPGADSAGGDAPALGATSVPEHAEQPVATVVEDTPTPRRELNPDYAATSEGTKPERVRRDSLAEDTSADASSDITLDTMALDTLPADTLTEKERRTLLKEEARKAKEEFKRQQAAERKVRLDEIARARQARATELLNKYKAREEALRALRLERALAREEKRRLRAERRGKVYRSRLDSTLLVSPDSLSSDSLAVDTLGRDSMQLDTLVQDSTLLPVDTLPRDSVYRLVRGFRNVRVYRSDLQAVCDSLTSSSLDSIIQLYIDPVLWHDANQVVSDEMKIHTRNSQLDRAHFVGHPIMSSQLDTMYYNQITGKEIISHFRDNAIYRNDVEGNARTLYYMQDGDTPDVTSLLKVESGSVSFYIEGNTVTHISYKTQPVFTVYPLEKIPEDQSLYLEDFKWQGERRPALEAVFDRTIRPSVREAKSQVVKPMFPTSRRIELFKTRIIEHNRWVDRDDKLTPEVEEWLHTLGY